MSQKLEFAGQLEQLPEQLAALLGRALNRDQLLASVLQDREQQALRSHAFWADRVVCGQHADDAPREGVLNCRRFEHRTQAPAQQAPKHQPNAGFRFWRGIRASHLQLCEHEVGEGLAEAKIALSKTFDALPRDGYLQIDELATALRLAGIAVTDARLPVNDHA